MMEKTITQIVANKLTIESLVQDMALHRSDLAVFCDRVLLKESELVDAGFVILVFSDGSISCVDCRAKKSEEGKIEQP